MNSPLVTLRAIGLLAAAAGVLDPGCAETRRPRIEVTLVGDVPALVRARTLGQLADAAPWATVADAAAVASSEPVLPPVAARVVAGDPAPVLRALEARPADLALQVDDPALTLTAVSVPGRVLAGMRTDVAVRVGGLPQGRGAARVVLRDPDSGMEQGRAEVDASAASHGQIDVLVPWLATHLGAGRLRAEASYDGAGQVRPASPADVAVDVRPATLEVAVLEARPTWAARFARLALAGADGVRLRSDVRVSPGVSVRTAPSAAAAADMENTAEVVLVGGVEALSSADVARLEREVRDRGRAVVLLVDDAPQAGPWRRLWPDAPGPVRSAALPVTGLVAGHPWKVREWLSPTLSTESVPLAYFDSGSTPFVMGRAVGAGRILLVTALDAWRWRAEEGVAFAAGWRALVLRLAADVPPPMTTTAWVSGRGRARTLHVDVALRPDVEARGGVAVTAALESGARRSVPVVPIEPGRWRGSTRLPPAAAARLQVEARAATQVVGRTHTVVDLRPPAPVASWQDVEQHQAARGALAAGPGTLATALTSLHARLAMPPASVWHVTRTWWFAAIALALLGVEWILRRLHGER